MRVLLIDNLEEERSALRWLFRQDPELSVVGEAAEADGLLTQLRTTQPDIVLMNWELPGLLASEFIRMLRGGSCPAKVVVYSKHPEANQDALAAGADAFVSKREPVQDLLNTVRAVARLSPCFV